MYIFLRIWITRLITNHESLVEGNWSLRFEAIGPFLRFEGLLPNMQGSQTRSGWSAGDVTQPRLYAFGGRNHESGPLDNVGGLVLLLRWWLIWSHVKLSCPDFSTGDELDLDRMEDGDGGSYSKFMVTLASAGQPVRLLQLQFKLGWGLVNQFFSLLMMSCSLDCLSMLYTLLDKIPTHMSRWITKNSTWAGNSSPTGQHQRSLESSPW